MAIRIGSVVAVLGAALAAISPANAQAPSGALDIPYYSLTGFISGTMNETQWRSSGDGHLLANGDPATFHYLSLRSESPQRLSFKVFCKFVNAAWQLKDYVAETAESCPPYGVPNSRFLQAVRIELAGPESGKFRLEMQCRFRGGGPGGVTTIGEYPRQRAQDWCGELNTQPDNTFYGLSLIEIWLTPR